MGANDEYVFLGCYTGETGGEGEGIALLRRDGTTGGLSRLGTVARTPSPSFLAQHPTKPVLYAVNELTNGTVSAFAVGPDASLTPLAVRSTGGADPCHLAVAASGGHLLVANYGSGSVAVFPLDDDGVPGEHSDLLDLRGSGPDAERQAGPHAHMVAPDPNGPDVLVSDLGSDRIWHARLDPVSGRLELVGAAVTTPPGTGPRHLLRTVDGALAVVGELSGSLGWYRRGGDGAWSKEGEAATSGGARHFPSEIVCGRDGRFVYVGNRGPDTVGVFAWEDEGATLVAEVATGGEWPRHIALLGDHLYVANERSHTVTIFRVDPDSGIPSAQGEPVGEGSPTCLLRGRVPSDTQQLL